MQNFNGLNKNIVILGAVFFALIVSLGIMLKVNKGSTPVVAPEVNESISLTINKDISDLDNIESDLSEFAQDDIVLVELDEILNEVGEIDETAENLIKDEENLSGLDSELEALSDDEAIDQEIDKTLEEMSL